MYYYTYCDLVHMHMLVSQDVFSFNTVDVSWFSDLPYRVTVMSVSILLDILMHNLTIYTVNVLLLEISGILTCILQILVIKLSSFQLMFYKSAPFHFTSWTVSHSTLHLFSADIFTALYFVQCK